MRKLLIVCFSLALLATLAWAKTPEVVKLGADWCPPCRQMKPIIAGLSARYTGKVIFKDLDIEKNEALAKQFKVSLIPTTIFYDKKGKPRYVKAGFMGKDEIISKMKELGMVK